MSWPARDCVFQKGHCWGLPIQHLPISLKCGPWLLPKEKHPPHRLLGSCLVVKVLVGKQCRGRGPMKTFVASIPKLNPCESPSNRSPYIFLRFSSTGAAGAVRFLLANNGGAKALVGEPCSSAGPWVGQKTHRSTPILPSGSSLHLWKLPGMCLQMHIPGSPRPT